MEKIRVLQAGPDNWENKYNIPTYVSWDYFDDGQKEDRPYDLVIIDGRLFPAGLGTLEKLTCCHRLYITGNAAVNMGKKYEQYLASNMAIRLEDDEIRTFVERDIRNFFHKGYGEKYEHNNLSVSPGFKGRIRWEGKYALCLDGEYGEDFRQIAFWRNTIPIEEGQAIDLWLEYEADDEVEIELEITQFALGSVSDIQKTWTFTEEDMKDVVYIENEAGAGTFFASVLAKGRGKLNIIALHDRYSRREYGTFLPGGERYVTSKREECFCYFEPGDMKPPLCVYFSGYKTLEGFEGINLMRRLGCPFLLVSEARLDGGCFYMGSDEFERTFLKMITDRLKYLGFTSEQLVLSGLSMGTFGALYYGCDLHPHAIISGKPLTSIGDIAHNEKHLRPGGFPTSLDVLKYFEHSMSPEAEESANLRLWNKFERANFEDTKFIISYMIEDDYDPKAYEYLTGHLHSSNVLLYGKGIHGRHNDDSKAVVAWFEDQYKQMLFADFDRRSSNGR